MRVSHAISCYKDSFETLTNLNTINYSETNFNEIFNFSISADCSVLTAPENGTISSTNRTYGSSVTVTCTERFPFKWISQSFV